MADVPALTELASVAAENADSYRRFRVGAALVGEELASANIDAFVAANSKPVPFSRKHCAEMKALAAARAAGFAMIHGLVVVGPSDPSLIAGVTSVSTPTLHPCGDCCQAIDFYQQEGELILPDATPVVTVGQEDRSYQIHTIGEIMVLHGHRPAASNVMPPAHVVEADGLFDLWQTGLEEVALSVAPAINPAAAMRSALAWAQPQIR